MNEIPTVKFIDIVRYSSKPNGEDRCKSEINILQKKKYPTSFNLCTSFSLKPSSSEFERKVFSSLTS